MIYTMICYRDKDLEKFLPPIVLPMNKEDTAETLRDSTVKGQIPDAENKEAYYLGGFDTETGKFSLPEKPELLFDLAQYVRK